MRLIGSLPTQKQADAFSHYLTQRELPHQIDHEQGEYSCWIHDEADILLAKQHLQDFLEAPDDPRFSAPKKDSISFRRSPPKKPKKLIYEYEIPRRATPSLMSTPINTGLIIRVGEAEVSVRGKEGAVIEQLAVGERQSAKVFATDGSKEGGFRFKLSDEEPSICAYYNGFYDNWRLRPVGKKGCGPCRPED